MLQLDNQREVLPDLLIHSPATYATHYQMILFAILGCVGGKRNRGTLDCIFVPSVLLGHQITIVFSRHLRWNGPLPHSRAKVFEYVIDRASPNESEIHARTGILRAGSFHRWIICQRNSNSSFPARLELSRYRYPIDCEMLHLQIIFGKVNNPVIV